MSTPWFIADPHLGHGNIAIHCKRMEFLNPEERRLLQAGERFRLSPESLKLMDDTIIDNINAVVQPNDVLWLIGDFCMVGRRDIDQATRAARIYRERINCRTVNLVRGNHDPEYVLPLFQAVYEQIDLVLGGQKVFLNHYPMMAWHHSYSGTWMLHGHVHGGCRKNPLMRALYDSMLIHDVGVDGPDGYGSARRFKPWHIEEIRQYMRPKIDAWRAYRAQQV